MEPLRKSERVAAVVIAALGVAFVAGAAAFTRPSEPPPPLPGTQDERPAGVASTRPPDGEGVLPPLDPNAPMGAVGVEINDEQGGPIGGATVQLFEVRGGYTAVGRGATGPDGTFRFARVPSGRSYCVMARAPGFAPTTTESMTLVPDAIAVRKLVLHRGTPVTIAVTRGAGPFKGATVSLRRAAAAAEAGVSVDLPMATLVTGDDGTVVVELAPGRYSAQVAGPPIANASFEHPRDTGRPVSLKLP